MTKLRPAVFFDRDGVLTEAILTHGVPRPARSGTPLQLRPGVEAVCRALREAGLLLVCVTNQPDIARGVISAASVAATNADLQARLGLEAVMVCPHDDADLCDCRKPLPGMLLQAAEDFGIDLERSVMVGDRWRDIEAGRKAGCTTIFIDNRYGERKPEHPDLTTTRLDGLVPEIINVTMKKGVDWSQRAPGMLTEGHLRVEIFADGADRASIVELAANPLIKGFTTNPTLMRAAGVSDYESFARDVVASVPGMPVSFEVFADDLDEMVRQARRISRWGDQVYVKIPVTNTARQSTARVVCALSEEGIKLNVTALFTVEQVRWVTEALAGGPSAFLSVFAGRIADSGRDPIPIMRESLEVMAAYSNLRLIWASPREILNIVQADEIGCHVITLTHDLLRKLANLGKDLDDFSLETVCMFHRDAATAGYVL